MKTRLLFSICINCIFCLSPIVIFGQDNHKNGLKIGLSGTSRQPHLTLDWEHRLSARKSLEIQFGAQWNLAKNYPVFIGDWSVQYMIAKIDSFAVSTQNNEYYFNSSTGWFYESALTKLPELPQYVQDRTMYGKIGLRSYFGKPERSLRPFVQPALSLLFDQDYFVTDYNFKVWEDTRSAYISVPIQRRINKTNELHKQIRVIELQSHWLMGIHYDAGFTWQPWKNLVLEAKFVTALNISIQRSTSPQLGIARKFYAGWALQAGWFF